MKKRVQLSVFLCLSLILGISLVFTMPKIAWASIHPYPESPNQIMYRSKQSLRDTSDLSWQVILFKRVRSGQVKDLHLRLVGFPGLVEVAHADSLKIKTVTDQTWNAADVTDLSLPSNVGEYDLMEMLPQLQKNIPLTLSLSLANHTETQLIVPPFVVKEWRKLLDLTELFPTVS